MSSNLFDTLSHAWWSPTKDTLHGLHLLNPCRLAFIKNTLADQPCRLLDIGCGGGLLSLPLARLGHNVTGIDASLTAINAAQAAAQKQNLNPTFIHKPIQDYQTTQLFDCLIASEVIEHINDLDAFITQSTRLLKPGGLFILSTLNRTWQSKFLGQYVAEHILKWAPKGAHDWHLFRTPAEVMKAFEHHNYQPQSAKGMVYNPLNHEFTLHKNNLNINYIITFKNNS
jgi:2-polyprenyl-6-hydroxyphenyl methylase/3-demethylubiquinone-9 3-methyltransferase